MLPGVPPSIAAAARHPDPEDSVAINYDRLMSYRHPEKTFSYGERETMLYALGIGFGADPMNRAELPFVYEKGLRAVPTLATVIAWDDSFIAQSGINFLLVVHGEQRIVLHRPLPVAAKVTAQLAITDIFDKGQGKGAIVLSRTTIADQATGEVLCTNYATTFARGDGGFGGPAGSGPAPHPLPDRAPERVIDLPTSPGQALLYALSGDRNPLHRDPAVAEAAGVRRPILHGLCTYGIACRAVLQTCCDLDPTRVREFGGRFSAPVFPGETIRVETWQEGPIVSFRASVPERGQVVLNNGRAVLAG